MKNLDKFKKNLQKKDISTEFISPDHWISTGNYALNLLMTGDYKKGIPNRRSVIYWGPKGSGKSYLLSLAALNAQKDGYTVIYIDTESAAEEGYMTKVGLDLSPDKFIPIPVGSIEQATATVSDLLQNMTPDDKVFLALDSLSMLLSEKEIGDFDSGIMKGDMGQLAKKLKLLMKNINNKVKNHDMFFVCTGHAYLNQDIRNGKGEYIFSGGEGVEFIPSVSVFLKRLKLKEGTEVTGIRIKAEVHKTRFTQAFGKIELSVPYDTGLDPIDGLLDIAVNAGAVERRGAWYCYFTDGIGEVKFQRKNFKDHYMNIFDFDSDETPQET